MRDDEDMQTTVSIAKRFKGPPASANGGYTCGITAGALVRGPAEASLRVPPPIERPLRIEVNEEGATLYDEESVVAQAKPAQIDVDVPDAVSLAEAEDAAERFDLDTYHAAHYFPGCFTCGPERALGDGLRLFPGRVDRPDTIIAWPWTPESSLPSEAGRIDPVIMWAALDCPSGWAWYHERRAEPHVLGRLAARIHRLPEPGERTVVAGWPIGLGGRKRHSASAIWSGDGELLALGKATWIQLTPAQFEQFRASVS